MKKTLGLYLGVNSLGVAVLHSKDIRFLGNFSFSNLEDANVEALNEDIRWEALINKAIREAGDDTEEVFVSLADRDFIFRSLEMPLMKKSEIESSLVYEIEKYIPFKINELEWSYESVRLLKEKKASVSFVGIKEANFQRIRDILARLKINPVAIEPSCLSLARVVKSLMKLPKIKNFALLDFTESESYLTFFQNDLPVFNRYLSVPKKEDSLDLNKFVESVDFSFQYFKREFKSYELEKFIVVGDAVDSKLVSLMEEGLQAKIEAVSSYQITSRNASRVESVKALGAAGRNHYPSLFKPVFKKAGPVAESPQEFATEIPSLRIGLLSALVGIGLAATLFISIVMGNEVGIKKRELKIKEEALLIPKDFERLDWKERKESLKQARERVSSLRNLKASFKDLSGIFAYLGRKGALPAGVWLDDLNIYRQGDSYKGTMTGYIFRDDSYAEQIGLNELVYSLKKDTYFKGLFSDIEVNSSKRQSIKEFEVTYFSLKLN
ncbi:MAG: pilus assembly protein PilM [Candidatus Omnitrophota bacterium]|jgi:hypothetical protein